MRAQIPTSRLSSRNIVRPLRNSVVNAVRKAAVPVDDEKDKKRRALDLVLADINSTYGKGTVMRMNDTPVEGAETVSSGALTLDLALGGGFPVGRIVEIFGPEASGKTTLALHAVAEIQKLGGTAAFIDAEHALDPKYAQRLGVDVNEMYICQPDNGEMALEVADRMIRSNAVSVVCIDSVSALAPKAELEGEIGQTQIGAQARLMSLALRKLSGNASKCKVMVIFINQLRNKINVMYGSPETTSGGNALKYYASVRVDVRRADVIKGKDGEASGMKVKAKVVKNKVAAPYRTAMFDIMFGSGINRLGCVLDVAEKAGVVTRRGTYYYYETESLGQGREKALAKLAEDKELALTIEKKVRDASTKEGILEKLVETGLADDGVEDDGAEFEPIAEPL